MQELMHSFDSPLGRLTAVSDGEHLVAIYFPDEVLPDAEMGVDEILRRTVSELEEYFSGKRKVFDIPCRQSGTDFQLKARNAMCDIPYGGSSTYGNIAETIGHPGAYRAVGTACGRNRIPIIIPCHRVLASSGIGGYAGGLEFKKHLLNLEARHI